MPSHVKKEKLTELKNLVKRKEEPSPSSKSAAAAQSHPQQQQPVQQLPPKLIPLSHLMPVMVTAASASKPQMVRDVRPPFMQAFSSRGIQGLEALTVSQYIIHTQLDIVYEVTHLLRKKLSRFSVLYVFLA